jgi:2-dehydropantoate 2-reductase
MLMNIGIIGAGGIGSYYAAQLAATNHDVVLFARGAHLEAIRQRGLELRTPNGSTTTRPNATDDGTRLADRDIVVVAVKGYSLADVAAIVARAAARGATIVPLLNGADIPQRLEALGVPRARIAGGLARVSVVRTAPGVVERRSATDAVIVGQLRGGGDADRLVKLVAALTSVGTNATMSADIEHDLWRKFAFIVPMAIACGLSRTSMGPVQAHESGRALLRGAIAEIVAVSRAAGPGLTEDDEAQALKDLLAVQPQVKPSFLLDLEQGGPTELDLLAGTVSRMGREHGIPTPISDVAVAAFEAAAG